MMDISAEALAAPFAATTDAIRWGVSLRRLDGKKLYSLGADQTLRIASVGKILLLIEVARQIEAGQLDLGQPLSRQPQDMVGGTGLWQHWQTKTLPLADVATLIAAFSDNVASNVLLDEVSVEAAEAVSVSLGLRSTRLHDRIRDRRGPEHPPTFASGSAAELSGLMAGLARGDVCSPAASARVLGWLGLNADLSLVAATWNLTPLIDHSAAEHGLCLHSKTGTDDGIRSEVGIVHGPNGSFAYTVIANWDAALHDLHNEVAQAMRSFGACVAP
jgi:beta-lactamase class A